jgi:hypothetical protein
LFEHALVRDRANLDQSCLQNLGSINIEELYAAELVVSVHYDPSYDCARGLNKNLLPRTVNMIRYLL